MQRFEHTDRRSLMFSRPAKYMFSLLDVQFQTISGSFVPLSLPIHIFLLFTEQTRHFPWLFILSDVNVTLTLTKCPFHVFTAQGCVNGSDTQPCLSSLHQGKTSLLL